MSSRTDPVAQWQASVRLIDLISHPNLVRAKFYPNAQKLIDIRRRVGTFLTEEDRQQIQQVIDRVVVALNTAIDTPTVENINEVFDLPEIKIHRFADRATVARIRRRSVREGDCLLLTQEFISLREHLLPPNP
jgi:hypothetical protein